MANAADRKLVIGPNLSGKCGGLEGRRLPPELWGLIAQEYFVPPQNPWDVFLWLGMPCFRSREISFLALPGAVAACIAMAEKASRCFVQACQTLQGVSEQQKNLLSAKLVECTPPPLDLPHAMPFQLTFLLWVGRWRCQLLQVLSEEERRGMQAGLGEEDPFLQQMVGDPWGRRVCATIRRGYIENHLVHLAEAIGHLYSDPCVVEINECLQLAELDQELGGEEWIVSQIFRRALSCALRNPQISEGREDFDVYSEAFFRRGSSWLIQVFVEEALAHHMPVNLSKVLTHMHRIRDEKVFREILHLFQERSYDFHAREEYLAVASEISEDHEGALREFFQRNPPSFCNRMLEYLFRALA